MSTEKNTVSIAKLFRYASVFDYFLIVVGTISAMVNGATLPVMTIVFGDIMTAIATFTLEVPPGANAADFIAESKASLDSSVRTGVIQMCIVGLVTFVSSYFQMACWMLAGENQTKRIREKYFEASVRQEIAWYDKKSTGEITNRLTSDMNIIQDGISDKIGLMIQFVTAFISGFIIGYVRGWKLALVLTGSLPFLAGAAALLAKILGGTSSEEQNEYAEAGGIAQQVISSIKTVVAFGGEEKEIVRYKTCLDKAEKTGIKKAFINGSGVGTFQLIIFLVYSLAFWFGNLLVPDELTIGEVLNVIFAVIIGAFSLGQASPHISSLGSALGTAHNIFETIDRVSQIDPLSSEGLKPNSCDGHIEFKDVEFHYPTRPDIPILKKISLDVGSGKSVALVGASGSGKSTVVKLIERFYDSISGQILLDGNDIKKLNVNWLRQQIGIVSQEPTLFNATIRENILLGLPLEMENYKAEELLEKACREANCYDFIQKLPNKFDTLVGESGSLLSGGQKQRIAIARAIIKNPKILLLDEATSALDTTSEKVVQEALENASKNRSTIVVAHRLSTVKNCDNIIVMENGIIVEQGPHQNLIEAEGVYCSLVNAQALNQVNEPSIALKPVESLHSLADNSVKENEKKSDTVVLKLQDKVDQPPNFDIPYRRLLKLNQPEVPLMIFAGIGAIANGASQPLFALIFANILDALGTKRANELALTFVYLAIAAFVANFLQIGVFNYCGEKMTRRIREMYFRALLKQEIAYFDKQENSTGSLTQKLATDASQVKGLTSLAIGSVIQGVSGIITGLTIAFTACWQLSLVILGMVPMIGFAGYLQMQSLVGFGTKSREAYALCSQKANETIQNIRTVAMLCQEKMFHSKFAQSILEPHSISVKGAVISATGFAASQAVLHFAWATSLYYGAQLMKMELYTSQDIFIAMFSIIFTAMEAGQMNSFAPDAAKAKLAAEAIFRLVDRESSIDVTMNQGVCREQAVGNATGRNVHFNYPSRPDTTVLDGLEFDARQGQTIALVGASGSGKSTVLGLLLRWYDYRVGKVTFDDLDIPEWNIKNLRSFMAIVGQEPVLFNISIRDNIAYGSHVVPDELAIQEAAKLANIHDFVMGLPDKYDTIVGEKGGQISGGQKQRISIARALIRNPKLLLLDEATSALDSESELVVQEALDAASAGRTTIVIAHRLSTIQNADLILVVEQGKIIEKGTHEELIEKKGNYFVLASQQQLK